MINENQENFDKELIKMLQTTKEYKTWQESLFAIIGYVSDEELDDENMVRELMADHLNASFQLNNGLEKAKYYTSKNQHQEWVSDHSGE
jgi:hypothetical protein